MKERELLDLLRGSPSGTTETMAIRHGATLAQLDRLVASGKARVEVRAMARPAMSVRWFFLAQ